MLFFIIVAIAGFIFGFVKEKFNSYYKATIGEAFWIGSLTSLFSTLIVFLLSLIITISVVCADINTTPITQTRIDLVALKDTNISYIRRSYSNDVLKYIYLYEEEGKGLATGSIPANQSYINYIEENEQPYIVGIDYMFTNPYARFFLIDSFINAEYCVYIPTGSIVVEDEYKIDLE